MYDVTPPEKLAIVYAAKPLRGSFEWLLTLDARLKRSVLGASEPLIAQIKLAWWRDAICAAPPMRPKGEPMLQQLADMNSQNNQFDLEQSALALVEAWEKLASADQADANALADYASLRGEALFGSYGRWSGQADLAGILSAGSEWALLDIGRASDAAVEPVRLPRPLAILYRSAKLEISGQRRLDGLRLLWHIILRK